METIKQLQADKGGTELYEPLNRIYSNKIYDEYDMKKNIILLTDGYLDDKEKVINLIGANSSNYNFNSIGIGNCDKDLIDRTALIGNGYSYYISELKELNSVIISLLEKTQNSLLINCSTNQKCSIEDNNKKLISKYDYFTHSFIIDDINLKNIEFIINIKEKEIKINFDKNKMIKLPDGDNLGKLIVDNYLKRRNCKDKETRTKLSKEYNILIDETAFYAKIANEVPVTEKMIKITNKDKEASNNKIDENHAQNIIKEDNCIYIDEIFGYDNLEESKTGFFSNFDNIIKKKQFVYERKNIKIRDEYCLCEGASPQIKYFASQSKPLDEEDDDDLDDFGLFFGGVSSKKESNEKKDEPLVKKEFNFDEFILSQDVLEGNWIKNEQSEMLIKQEKDIYEKIKKYSEDIRIKEENGIITLFALYFIYNKKKDKINELKFIIDKAKDYIKQIFNLEYDVIVKEIETK